MFRSKSASQSSLRPSSVSDAVGPCSYDPVSPSKNRVLKISKIKKGLAQAKLKHRGGGAVIDLLPKLRLTEPDIGKEPR
jgi:hypothetical protein